MLFHLVPASTMLLFLSPAAVGFGCYRQTTSRIASDCIKQYRSSWISIHRRSACSSSGSSSSSSSSNGGALRSSSSLITSTKSNTVKHIQSLLTKRKKRVELGQVVVEGPRMVFDLWNSEITRPLIQQVLVDVDRYDEYAPHFLLQDGGTAVRVLSATSEVLQACTDTVNNQGILAVCNIPNWNDDTLSYKNNNNDNHKYPMYLVADAIADPGNLGTLIRSAAACGAVAVYLLPNSCDPWNPKAVRSAMGNTFSIPVWPMESWEECLERLHAAGCSDNIWAATMLDDHDIETGGTKTTAHYNVDWTTAPAALIIGSEGNGLTPALRQAAHDRTIRAVHVPMQAGVESLNAAVCGSVILFEYLRQQQILEKK